MQLSFVKVAECPFSSVSIAHLKSRFIEEAGQLGVKLHRESGDRNDIPIDHRFIDLLLREAGDLEVSLGSFAAAVRVGPGPRLLRLPWRRGVCLEKQILFDGCPELTKVLDDQATRSQVTKHTEEKARRRFPNLVVASDGRDTKGQARRRHYQPDVVRRDETEFIVEPQDPHLRPGGSPHRRGT